MAQQIDLKEYPEGHEGRKSYVFVPSLGKVVAACYTAHIGGELQVLPEYGGPAIDCKRVGSTVIMADIGEYVSPIDNTRVTTRSQHRDHIRRHDVVEVGNERIGGMGRPEYDTGRRAGHDIREALQRARQG